MAEWNLPSVVEFFREDPEIAGALSAEDFSDILNPQIAFLNLIRTALQYQGFDPRVGIKQMIRNRNQYNNKNPVLQNWDLSNINDDFNWTEQSVAAHRFTNQMTLIQDVGFLLIVFLNRNYYIEKVIRKSRYGLRLDSILGMLREKYDINYEYSGTSLGSTEVTLPRIAWIFPSYAVKLYHERKVKEILPLISIPGYMALSEQERAQVTHALCSPYLVSCHPQIDEGSANLHAVMMYVRIRLDDVIHKKRGDFTGLYDIISYYNAAYNSTSTPAESRVFVFRRLGITSAASPEAIQRYTIINAACLKALGAMRTNDPHHANMLAVATEGPK